MSEKNPSQDDIRQAADNRRDLAREEKQAARTMTLGNHRWALLVALVLYLAYLVLPHAGSVLGFQVLLRMDAATEAGIKITEYIYAILLFLGLGVFTTLTVITRRTVFGLIAWMFSTVGLFYSVFALWLRQTRPVSEAENVTGIGLWLSIIAVALAVVAYSMVALRRDPRQKRIAEERARGENLDEVGFAQREARVSEQNTSYEANPLFADDRRRRAAERHRRPGQADGQGQG